MKENIFLAVCFTFISSILFAQRNDSMKFIRGARVISENDVFFPVNNKDENYTGQFRFDIYTKGILDKGKGILFPRNKNNNKEFHTEQSLFLHGMGYTPARRYFDSTNVILEDRPFASYICLGFQRTALFEHGDKLLFDKLTMFGDLVASTELSFGRIGSKTPGEVQNFLHEYIAIKSKPVKGWPNQIGAPGRFAFHLKLNYKYYFPSIIKLKFGFGYESLLGYFMDYSKFSLLISNKRFDLYNVEIPSMSPESPQLRHCTQIGLDRTFWQKLKHSTSIEFAPSIKRVYWNSMLSGHPVEDHSVYKINSDRVYKWLPECNLKVVFNFCNKQDQRLFSLYYALNWRGKEYIDGDASHFYGSIGVRTIKF